MILTTLPDLPPRPLTAGNAAFRERQEQRQGSGEQRPQHGSQDGERRAQRQSRG